MLARAQLFFAKTEAMPISFKEWCVAVCAIIAVRLLLEDTSNGGQFGVAGYEFTALVHIGLYFVAAIIAITLVLAFFAKKNIAAAAKVNLIFFPIIWTAPIADHFSNWLFGTGMQMSYVFQDGAGLLRNFLTFFGSHTLPGATVGIRFAIVLLLIFTFFYVFSSTKKIWRSAAAVFFMYGTIFLCASWPSLPGLVAGSSNLGGSFLASTKSFFLERSVYETGMEVAVGEQQLEQQLVYVDREFAHALYIAVFLLSLLAALGIWGRKFIAILRHSRVLFSGKLYIISIFLGMAFALRDGNSFSLAGWVDITFLAILILSFLFSWIYAAGLNDLADVEGDKLTNSKRPLVTGEATREDMVALNLAALFFALVGGYLLGQFMFLLILAYIALAHLYSCPPFRLKLRPVFAQFTISLSVLLPVLAGYFALSEDRNISAFPREFLLLLLLAHMAWVNAKDLKDLEGDRLMGSRTLPVIFGLEKSKKIIGALSAGAFLLFPLFLGGGNIVWLVSLSVAALSYFSINRPAFSLRSAFLLIAGYLLFVSGVLLWPHSWNMENFGRVGGSPDLSSQEYAAALEKYIDLLSRKDPRVALAALQDDIDADDRILRACHPFVHDIGHAAYEKYGSFGESAKYMDTVCASGYLHGVIESRFSTGGDIFAEMKAICREYPLGKFMGWACYHGVGHGVMYYTNNDLPKSLEYCEMYDDAFARASCVNGVFMENFNTNQKEHISKYLDENDVLSPCREQAERYKADCYWNSPVYHEALNRGDYDGAVAVCKYAEPLYRAACASGAGGVAIQENMDNPKFVEKICARGDPSLVAGCIKGMTEIMIVNNASLEPAEKLCKKLHTSNREACYATVEHYRSWF